jgi:hypothetical protein
MRSRLIAERVLRAPVELSDGAEELEIEAAEDKCIGVGTMD